MNVEKTARSAYQAALTEFRTAAGAIVERLKSGVPFSPADWEREKTARVELPKCRELVARLRPKKTL
jgi:hypothetical protein